MSKKEKNTTTLISGSKSSKTRKLNVQPASRSSAKTVYLPKGTAQVKRIAASKAEKTTQFVKHFYEKYGKMMSKLSHE